ncbi:MAG: T9SS type A sorting domain-containing protein [Bacteroidia bacterium]
MNLPKLIILVSVLLLKTLYPICSKAQTAVDWAYTLDGFNTTDLADLEMDEEGNTYALAGFTMHLKIKELKKEYLGREHWSGVIVKFSPKGKPVWSRLLKSSVMLIAKNVVIAQNGDILVTGNADGQIVIENSNNLSDTFGRAKTEKEYNPPNFAFAARFSKDGELRWCNALEMSKQGGGICMAENSKGQIFWKIYYNEKVYSKEKEIGSLNNEDRKIFHFDILKLTAEGEILGKHPSSYAGLDKNQWLSNRMLIDADDALITHGSFKSKLLISKSDSLINDGYYDSYDAYVIKYNKAEELEWYRQIGGQNDQEIRGIALDKDQGISIVGEYDYECQISAGLKIKKKSKFEYKSGSSFFYCRFTKNGNLDYTVFKTQNEYSEYAIGRAIAVDQNDETHILGLFSDSLQFGNLAPIPGKSRIYHGFYSQWNKAKPIGLNTPILDENLGVYPSDVICKNGRCVVGGGYHGKKSYMPNVNGKKYKFSAYEHGRASFIYGFKIADKNKTLEEKDTLDRLAQITPVLACLPPELIEQDNIWVPYDSSTLEIGDTTAQKTSSCGVIIEQCTVSIFPNPTNGPVTLELKGLLGEISLQILSSNGALLTSQNLQMTQTSATFELDFSSLTPGTYFINVVQCNFHKVLRVVKS